MRVRQTALYISRRTLLFDIHTAASSDSMRLNTAVGRLVVDAAKTFSTRQAAYRL
jgi:hypothetical protein